MNIMRITVGLVAGLLGNTLLVGASLLLGNHLFAWSPTKVSVEWQTTLRFAAMYALVGTVPAIVAAMLLRSVARVVTVAMTAVALVGGWVFLCLLVARMNAGYLWVIVGVPVFSIYFIVRGAQHIRARAA